MALTRIQKTFVRLASTKWGPMGTYKTRRRKLMKYSASKKRVNVQLIDAVTGEMTSARAFDDSPSKLKKWLQLRNVRAEFFNVLLKKKSTWIKLTDLEFIDYPIIVKVGNYKAPYLIKRIQDRVTYRKKTTCTLQLETSDNINYLSILSTKKELVESKRKKDK